MLKLVENVINISDANYYICYYTTQLNKKGPQHVNTTLLHVNTKFLFPKRIIFPHSN